MKGVCKEFIWVDILKSSIGKSTFGNTLRYSTIYLSRKKYKKGKMKFPF